MKEVHIDFNVISSVLLHCTDIMTCDVFLRFVQFSARYSLQTLSDAPCTSLCEFVRVCTAGTQHIKPWKWLLIMQLTFTTN